LFQEIEDIAVPAPVTGKRKRRTTATAETKNAKRTKAIEQVPYYGNKQEGKAPPHGKPAVWSENRQGLCEALPYYNAYQSGAYTNGGMVYGFLCDGEVGDRDYFGNHIMIARV
jgi:hypothetical protein